jgi:hypothetical protein
MARTGPSLAEIVPRRRNIRAWLPSKCLSTQQRRTGFSNYPKQKDARKTQSLHNSQAERSERTAIPLKLLEDLSSGVFVPGGMAPNHRDTSVSDRPDPSHAMSKLYSNYISPGVTVKLPSNAIIQSFHALEVLPGCMETSCGVSLPRPTPACCAVTAVCLPYPSPLGMIKGAMRLAARQDLF